MTEREKIHSGDIYWPSDPTIMEEQLAYLDLMDEYNNTPRRLMEERAAMLPKLFAEVGEGCYIESPYFANWGGHHVHLGRNIYANAGLKLVDDTHIYIGDYTMLGPNVVIATAAHPIDAGLRRKGLQNGNDGPHAGDRDQPRTGPQRGLCLHHAEKFRGFAEGHAEFLCFFNDHDRFPFFAHVCTVYYILIISYGRELRVNKSFRFCA